MRENGMMSTLEKVKCLESYLAADNFMAGTVLDQAITKLLARERGRLG